MNPEVDTQIEEYKRTLAERIGGMSGHQLKGFVTRLKKELNTFSEECGKFNIKWYPTWRHVDLEVLYNHRDQLDEKYAKAVESCMAEYQRRLVVHSMESILKSPINEDRTEVSE